MKVFGYLTCFIILLIGATSFGQQLQFDYIGDKLGLPAHECYNVIQDSRGYIWISTEAGLCRYNGTTSRIFDKKNGLPENACYAVSEDSKGRLWLLTSANRVLFFINDSLKESKFSKGYAGRLKGGLQQGYNLFFRNDSVIISTQNSSFISAINSSSLTPLLTDTSVGYFFTKSNGNLVNIKSGVNRDLATLLASQGKITISIKEGRETKKINLDYKNKQALLPHYH